MMKVKDFQFVNHFIQNNVGIDYDSSKEVHVLYDDKTDMAINNTNSFELHSPTSVVKSIFNIIYYNCCDKIANPYKKDIFSLMLNQAVNDYVYQDFTPAKQDAPSIIVSCSKIIIPFTLINEIIEPIIDRKIDLIPVLFAPCAYTDVCRIINSYQDLEENDKIHAKKIPFTKFPLLLCNCSVSNRASLYSHLLIKQLEHSIGESKTINLIRKILLDNDVVLSYMIEVLNILENNACFVDDYIAYLKTYADMTKDEINAFNLIIKLQYNKVSNLKKYAQNYNTEIEKQWTQWSSMLGLIEKQLQSFRGTKTDTSALMKEFDDESKMLANKKRKENKKNILNFEELLEIYREKYNDYATEPGKLYETLLSKNRVW